MNTPTMLLLTVAFFLLFTRQAEAKVLTQCQAVKELQVAGVSRTLMSNWVCLMENVSHMNTRLVTGPGTAASFSFGIFQINSRKWCVRGRKGGLCNKRCEDFADDNIQDDIVCANKILDTEGFKSWEAWMKKCKNKPLPNIGHCKRK